MVEIILVYLYKSSDSKIGLKANHFSAPWIAVAHHCFSSLIMYMEKIWCDYMLIEIIYI